MTRKKRVKKYFAQFKNPYTVVMFLFMLIYVGTFAYTIWWGLISSLKEPGDYYVNLYGLPKKWAFSNYSLAFSELYVVVNNMRYYLPMRSAMLRSLQFRLVFARIFARNTNAN